MYLILGRNQIRNNWPEILNDPDNPRPDIKDPDEFIKIVEKGLTILGATVVLQDDLILTVPG